MNTITNANRATAAGAGVKNVRPARRNSTTSINLIITMTSFMATMTGWAVFANHDYTTWTTREAAPIAVTTDTVAQALPTIEPLIAVDTATQVAQVSTNTRTAATTIQQTTSVARSAPRTVTTTRSSR